MTKTNRREFRCTPKSMWDSAHPAAWLPWTARRTQMAVSGACGTMQRGDSRCRMRRRYKRRNGCVIPSWPTKRRCTLNLLGPSPFSSTWLHRDTERPHTVASGAYGTKHRGDYTCITKRLRDDDAHCGYLIANATSIRRPTYPTLIWLVPLPYLGVCGRSVALGLG